MVNDQEPRYRLVDSDGTVVGSVYNENGDTKIQDAVNNTDRLIVRQGGPVEVTGGSDLRLDIGQSIQGGGGTDRVKTESDRTVISNEAGKAALDVKSGVGHDLIAASAEPVRLFDSEGSFTAFKYSTSSSRPGSLVLENTVLDFQAGQASITKDSMTANPETDAEDGFIQVNISGTRFQIPAYSP